MTGLELIAEYGVMEIKLERMRRDLDTSERLVAKKDEQITDLIADLENKNAQLLKLERELDRR